MTQTIHDIKAANEKAGCCFFGAAEMKRWGDHLDSYRVAETSEGVFLVRVKAAIGYDGKRDQSTIGEVWEFYPETGRIGVPLDRMKGKV